MNWRNFLNGIASVLEIMPPARPPKRFKIEPGRRERFGLDGHAVSIPDNWTAPPADEVFYGA